MIEKQKTSSVRRGHMIARSRSLIFQNLLPELAPCLKDRLSRHHRAGPSASLDKSVALFSCWGSLYHRRQAVSIGNLHETDGVNKLATCPTRFDRGTEFLQLKCAVPFGRERPGLFFHYTTKTERPLSRSLRFQSTISNRLCRQRRRIRLAA